MKLYIKEKSLIPMRKSASAQWPTVLTFQTKKKLKKINLHKDI